MTFPGRWIAISRLCQPNSGGPSVPRGTTTLVAKPGQEFYCERTKCARNSQLMLVQPRGHFWLTKLAYSLLNLRKGSNGLALRAETDSSDNRRIVLGQAYSFCVTIAPTRQEDHGEANLYSPTFHATYGGEDIKVFSQT